MDKAEAWGTIKAFLGDDIIVVVRSMVDYGHEIRFMLGFLNGERIYLGAKTVLSGCRLQERMMNHGRMIRRLRLPDCEKLGAALLAVAEREDQA